MIYLKKGFVSLKEWFSRNSSPDYREDGKRDEFCTPSWGGGGIFQEKGRLPPKKYETSINRVTATNTNKDKLGVFFMEEK
ncbi:MAG: hypothetical protein J7L69_05485 [Desulfobulbaceae bacterium]|nr:hypothetical protein [Desulfobulbaceae bacterium]